MKRLSLLVSSLLALNAFAAVELPEALSDHAVLQQLADARLWGWASPGAAVEISPSWSTASYKVTADIATGRWTAAVATPAASFEPQTITFDDGDGALTISDILIGEVWFCSGQSNMLMPLNGFEEQPVEGAEEAIAAAADYPSLRLLRVGLQYSYTEVDRAHGKWQVSSPTSASGFSAVGWFFGQSLMELLDVPVGVICSAWGGTKLEAWLPKEVLDTYPGFDMRADEKKTTIDSDRIGAMFYGMIQPLSAYSIKGFLWNQGENNVGQHASYPQHQKDLVETWRKLWDEGDIPFYFVELPGYGYGNPDGNLAALFRECQHHAAEIIPNSGIVCTSDLVYPHEVKVIHGSRKREIGERLAFMAASRSYGIPGLPVDYPFLKAVDYEGGEAVLWFDNAPDGLLPGFDMPGFEVADFDGVFHPARAEEDPLIHCVTVRSERVSQVRAVRYCFKNFAIGEVHNRLGLPLIPFNTEVSPTLSPVDYFNLQGMRIASPPRGTTFIRSQGNKAEKLIIR